MTEDDKMDAQESALTGKEWPEKNSALKSPWVLGWLAMVAVIITANVVMMTFAYKTSPGLVVEDYYEKGKNYNKSLEKISAQEALGWDVILLAPEKSVVGEKTEYGLTVTDQNHAAVTADKVELYAFRPSNVKADFSALMKLKGDGRYFGDITFPLPGVWDIVVSIVRDSDQFEVTERVFISKKEGS